MNVAIHRFSITAAASEVARFTGLLTDDERVRAARYRWMSDRVRFIVTRARLRILLARECGTAPRALRFAYGPHGKPWLPAHPGLRFSLSHAGDAALVAVARDCEVGIDLERASRQGNLAEVATRFFSPAERAALAALDDTTRPAALLRCWCRKEAYVKARGDGLTRPLDSFDVAVGVVAEGASVLIATRPDAADAAVWHVRDLDVGAGWVAALAVGRRPFFDASIVC